MKLRNKIMMGTLALFALVGFTGCSTVHATKVHPPVNMHDRVLEITLTNLTHGMEFTPMLVASHNSKYKMFELGKPASNELERLSESGNLIPMETAMMADTNVHDIVKTPAGLLAPGESVTVQIKTNLRMSFISVAGMILPTNDAFYAVNATNTHHIRHGKIVYSVAYDGSGEINSELCRDIPGNIVCDGTGEGYNPAGGEGFVHVHQGLHHIGSLHNKHYDWRNPVAKIEIVRVK